LSVEGILNVNKPSGWTSFDVVAFVRRRSGVRRVGHAGTLDPTATGVLPVCIGRATRVIEYLMDARKTYAATVLLGTETDTYDLAGTVLGITDATALTPAMVTKALDQFRGDIEQTPPAFSALKQGGVPLYKLARAGKAVKPVSRQVTVFRLDVLWLALPRIRLLVECSKGTYIRSLAHDLGAALGVGGCLEALDRTRVGPFALGSAVSPDLLEREFPEGAWMQRLFAPDEVLLDWPAAIAGDDNAVRIKTGRNPLWSSAHQTPRPPSDRCRAYSTAGDFLAVLRREGSEWRPEKVFV
jgi:tRNA pseudouridine55 synthase